MDESDFRPSDQSLSGSKFGEIVNEIDIELGNNAISAEATSNPEIELCTMRLKEFLLKFSNNFESCIQNLYLSPSNESGLRILIQQSSDVVDKEDMEITSFCNNYRTWEL